MIDAAYFSPKKLTYIVLLVYPYISYIFKITTITFFKILGNKNISQDIFLQSCWLFLPQKHQNSAVPESLLQPNNHGNPFFFGDVMVIQCGRDRWMVRFACRIPDDFWFHAQNEVLVFPSSWNSSLLFTFHSSFLLCILLLNSFSYFVFFVMIWCFFVEFDIIFHLLTLIVIYWIWPPPRIPVESEG